MFVVHLPHLIGHLSHVLPHVVRWLFALAPLQIDPLQTIMGLMNSLGSYFNTSQQEQMQQQVFGQQESADAFAQNQAQMNQYMTALQSPYAFGNVATPGTSGQANQFMQAFQSPYSSIANPQTAAQQSQYLQGMQTPYQQALGQQTPGQMTSLENQYMQGLNSGLTSGVWNTVQDQLAQSGMTQAPGVAAYNYSQALAPYYQQNLGLAAQQAAAPVQYGLQEQQLAQQAGMMPLNWQQAQQTYGLQAAGVPLNYGLNTAGMGIGEAQYGLTYPLNIGSQLAGQFPNYQYGAGGTA
jgi:hypothetical protein